MALFSGETKGKVIVILILIGLIGASLLLGVAIFELPWKSSSSDEYDLDLSEALSSNLSPLEQAEFLLERFPVIDGHNDLPWNIRKFALNDFRRVNFSSDLTKVEPWASYNESHTDIPRLRKGHVGAQFWVAYTHCESQGKDSVYQTIEQIDAIHRLVDAYPEDLYFCASAECIENTVRNRKKIASLIGVEGGHSIQSSPGILRQMYVLGVRYLTLTHGCNTPWVDASPVDSPDNPTPSINNGLSSFGLELIDEMNRLGIMVDLSHVSEATMRMALTRSMAPVMFSHSCTKALCDHHRNVADDILQDLKANEGIIMVNFYSKFVQCNSSRNATVQDVADHIEHVRSVIGADYIGLGGDFDGVDSVPQGLEDVSTYPNLFAELIERNWSLDELKKISYLNILRVMRKVEEVSTQLENEPPMQTVLSGNELHRKNFSTSECISPKSLFSLKQREENADFLIDMN